MKYPVVADSRANYHSMYKEMEFFERISPICCSVILGDGKTLLNIKGVGTVKLQIGLHTINFAQCIIHS
jgi:hypothetical protein